MGWIMMFFWVFVLAGIFLLIKWLLQITGSETRFINAGDRALDILKERYARGEVDKIEFDRKRRDLA